MSCKPSRFTGRAGTRGTIGARKTDRGPAAEPVVDDSPLGGADPHITALLTAAGTAPTYVDRIVVDQRGRRIGTVQSVHLNVRTGQPEWITVRIDRWTQTRHVAPLAGSILGHHDLRLPFDALIIRRAPPVIDADHMNIHDQLALYSYYLQKLARRSHE
jgi:sporulation protein YlmC with PRC-barrel domain